MPGKRVDLALSLFEHVISRDPPVQLLLAIASPRPSTLARIAAAQALHGNRVRAVLDATADQIRQWNQLEGDRVKIGQRLLVKPAKK